MSVTLLDPTQVLQQSFDDANKALRVDGIGVDGAIPVILTSAATADVILTSNVAYTNLTTSYYEVVHSIGANCSSIAIYDTSGETMQLALGSSGSEVVKLTIGPGNDQIIQVDIPSGSRVTVRTVGENATAGSLILNFIG